MGVTSNNPNDTSGRERKTAGSLRFPLTENLPVGTRLRFVEYNRFTPSNPGEEKTTAIITLPLPITIPENYSIRTNGQHDMGVFGNITKENYNKIMDAGNGADWSPEEVTKLGVQMTTDLLRNRQFSQTAALNGLSLAVASSDMKRTIQSFAGVTQNPHTTVNFEGVNLRGINLEWRFSPRSADESRALKNICDTIKLRSHPEELAGGYALNYPDLVYVEWFGKVEEWFPKYQKAFVNNINITPDTNNGMALYKTGAPVSYNVQLSMMELSIMTRNTLQEQIGSN